VSLSAPKTVPAEEGALPSSVSRLLASQWGNKDSFDISDINKQSECSPQRHKMAGDAQKFTPGQLEGLCRLL